MKKQLYSHVPQQKYDACNDTMFSTFIIKLKQQLNDAKTTVAKLIIDNQDLKNNNQELEIKNAELIAENELLKKQNKEQNDRIDQFNKKLKTNSTTSSLPPSQDNLAKAKTKKSVNSREKSDKNSGGQNGHKGHNLEFETHDGKITDHIKYQEETCVCCGKLITNQTLVETRQVHDIIVKKVIINHEIYSGKCECGYKTKVEIAIPHGTSYGNTLKSTILYLQNQDLIPTNRLAQVAKNLFKIPVNESSIYNWQKKFAESLSAYEEIVMHKLLQQKTLHSDESGLKTKLKQWLHVVCNESYTFYSVHNKRGMKALEDINIVNNFNGNLMHDCYASYFKLDNVKHGLCNAHLLRELKSFEQFYNLQFANDLRTFLKNANNIVIDAKEKNMTALSIETKSNLEQAFHALLIAANKEILNLQNAIWQKEAQTFLKRLRKYWKEYLAFMYDFNIPFTNNQAERDIRMIKVKQKISGRFRTEEGAKQFLTIRGFISTMQKHGKDVLTAIENVVLDPADFCFSDST